MVVFFSNFSCLSDLAYKEFVTIFSLGLNLIGSRLHALVLESIALDVTNSMTGYINDLAQLVSHAK